MLELEVNAKQEQEWKVETLIKITKKRIDLDCYIVKKRRN